MSSLSPVLFPLPSVPCPLSPAASPLSPALCPLLSVSLPLPGVCREESLLVRGAQPGYDQSDLSVPIICQVGGTEEGVHTCS